MPKPPVNLTLTVEFVTPEMAIEWLDKNTHNRKMSDRLVMVYAHAIKNEEWKLNGEPIIFDKKGRLQSGQHRLAAVIEAETGIWTVVVRGAEPEGIYSLDSGRRRRMTDVLTLRGEKDVANLGAAITWWWRYTVGAMDRLGETATTTHLLKVLDETPSLREALVQGRRLHQSLGFSAGLMTALYMAFAEKDQDDADFFVEQLFTQANLDQSDPAYTLVRWARNARQEARRPSQVTVAAVTVKAWNAFREHRVIRSLTFKGNEEFPVVV